MFKALASAFISVIVLVVFTPLNPSYANEKAVLREVAKKAAIISRKNKRASKALVNVAQNKAFSHYYDATSDDERIEAKQKIEQISLSMQHKFSVDEMCLIGKDGVEVARIVHDSIAHDSDLSHEEASAPFFAPAFAADHRKAVITDPYLSADSLRWVIAYTTPIDYKGEKPAILHYEHSIYQYQEALNKDFEGSDDYYLIALNSEGYILSDSREKFALEVNHDESEHLEHYFSKIDYSDSVEKGALIEDMLGNDRARGYFNENGAEWFAASKKADGWTIIAVEKQT